MIPLLLYALLPWTEAFVISPSSTNVRATASTHHVSIAATEDDSATTLTSAQGNAESSSRSSQETKDKNSNSATPGKEGCWSTAVAKKVFTNTTSPVLLFDGVCNLCNEAVNLCLDLDDEAVFRYASLQSKVGQALLIQNGRDPNDRSTMVLVTANPNGQDADSVEISCYTGSDAVLHIASELKGLPTPVRLSAQAARAMIPQWFRDALLKFVGKNRFIFGETDGPTCRLDLDGVYESRFVEDPEIH